MAAAKKNGNGHKAAPARSRTRTETAAAFGDLQEAVSNKEPVDPKTQAAVKAHRLGILEATSRITQESVVETISGLTLTISKQLAGLQETLLDRVTQRDELDTAIANKKSELEELHGVDIAASAIDDLVADFAEKKAAFQKETDDRFAVWSKQDEDRRNTLKADNDKQAAERTREKDQYEYAKANERRNAEDSFNQKLQAQARENALKQSELERQWADREEELKKRENEIVDLRVKVAGFEETTKKEIDKAVAMATNGLKRDLTHTFEMTKKDLETQLTIANSASVQAQLTIAGKDKTIGDLQTALSQAQNKVSDMANKALDASSGREAMTRVQETLQTTSTPKKG